MKSRYPLIGSAPKRDIRRLVWTLTVQTVLVGVFALLFSLGTFHVERKPGFTPIPRKPYTPALNPIALAELGLAPDTPGTDRAELAKAPKDSRVRLISVRPEGIALIQGGETIRSIPTATPPGDLDQLTALIADGSWLDRSIPGHFVLSSALVVYRGVRFLFGGPLATEIALRDQFSVFLGSFGAAVTFDAVEVRAIDLDAVQQHRYRPFVIATKGSEMNIRASRFSGLGWDWNGSYGVSWMQGSTGDAVDSTFENGYIGVYTARAVNVTFRRCVFRDNDMYGLDPHTYSRRLTVDDVVAEGNGAHGIIFSDNVTDSIVTNSVSRDNGENGIMLDKRSTGNRIVNNTVSGNRGDGLVTSDSPDNVFLDNTIESNRVGIRVSPPEPAGTVFRGNRVLRNGSSTENITLSEANILSENGGSWNRGALTRIWPIAALVLGLIGVAHTTQTFRRLRRAVALHHARSHSGGE